MISLPQGREPTPSYPASPNPNHSPANEMALVTHDPHLAAVTIAAHTQLSAIESQALSSVASSSTSLSPTRTSRSTSSRQSAASSLFIPRTSHNSQGIRKPLNKCSLLELNTMFEKLSNIVMVSSQNQFSNKVNLKRVKTDLEEIKRRIDYLEGIKGLDGAMKNTHISNGENLQQTNGNGKGKERELDYRGANSDINSKSLDQALQDLSIDGVKSNTSPKLSRAAQMELKREENSVSERKMRGKVGRRCAGWKQICRADSEGMDRSIYNIKSGSCMDIDSSSKSQSELRDCGCHRRQSQFLQSKSVMSNLSLAL